MWHDAVNPHAQDTWNSVFFRRKPFWDDLISCPGFLPNHLNLLECQHKSWTNLQFVASPAGPTTVIDALVNASSTFWGVHRKICWTKLLAWAGGRTHTHMHCRDKESVKEPVPPLWWAECLFREPVFSARNKTLMKIYNCENHHLITTCWGAVSFSSFQE